MSRSRIRLLTKFFCTARRRMPKHHCRLRSKAWKRTTSVSWRSPIVPPPSSRSSQSGSSTPSTWTDARSRWLLYVRCLTTIQRDLKLYYSVLHLTAVSYKSSQHELQLLLGFYKPVPTWTTSHPSSALWICGVSPLKTTLFLGKNRGIEENEQWHDTVPGLISMHAIPWSPVEWIVGIPAWQDASARWLN